MLRAILSILSISPIGKMVFIRLKPGRKRTKMEPSMYRIKTYGSTVRYSHDARQKTKVLKFGVETFPRSEQINKKIGRQELLFAGRLFVLTSPNTFSSANMFAAVIQDNRIGTIVGEPTGNQPSCYGHPLSFRMPRTGISFKISRANSPSPTMIAFSANRRF